MDKLYRDLPLRFYRAICQRSHKAGLETRAKYRIPFRWVVSYRCRDSECWSYSRQRGFAGHHASAVVEPGSMRNIKENLFYAFLYNGLGVPVAAGVLYPFAGLLLSPMLAAAAMSFSSVSVVANALRLRRLHL